MTVRELIVALTKTDPNSEAIVGGTGDYFKISAVDSYEDVTVLVTEAR